MIGTKADEYQHLAHESSSRILEYESRWVLGRYEEAAYHALQAGTDRTRMGRLSAEAEEWSEAVEDWLSAVACFLRATARKQAADVLELLHRLDGDGKIPMARPDLHAALRERERELDELNEKVEQLLHNFGLQGHQVDMADERHAAILTATGARVAGIALAAFRNLPAGR